MAKIFVSYKYKDNNVQPLNLYVPGEDTGYMHSPRHYVDYLTDLIGSDHIYKGEKSGDDASHLADDTIDSRLKEKIFDSSITIVLMSPNMWDRTKTQKEQWIPNEVYYSLRNKSRNGRISRTNGMLLVVLPDYLGNYDYAVIKKPCGVTQWQTDRYFHILNKNMFNRKEQNKNNCTNCFSGHHFGKDHSYIHPVKWVDFINDHNHYIEYALSLRAHIDSFELVKHRGEL